MGARNWPHEEPRALTAHVYMLRCRDGRYYTGSTRTDLDRRVAEHNAGTFGGFTKGRRPVALVFIQAFENVSDAVAAERQLKGWSRAKKEALIRGDMKALRTLSKRRRKTASSFETRAAPAPQDEAPGVAPGGGGDA